MELSINTDGLCLNLNPQHRPCFADGKKALFHAWVHWSEPIPPVVSAGGQNGGTVQGAYGIVEYEDGTVGSVPPQAIRFADGLIAEYAFKGGGGKQQES